MKLTLLIFTLMASVAFGQLINGTLVNGTLSNSKPRIMATATDTFNRGDEDPLVSTMSDGVGTWTSGPGAMDNVRIGALALFQSTGAAGVESGCRVLSPTFSANQSASIYLQPGSPFASGVMVRMQSTTDSSGYVLSAVDATHLAINKVTDTGTFAYTQLGAQFTVGSVGGGSKLTLSINGTTMEAFLNDVSQGTRTDSTYSTGQPGCYLFGPSTSMINFSATDLTL